MATNITHNTRIKEGQSGTSVQSYAAWDSGTGQVVIDYNGLEMQAYQRWSIEDAESIARLLTLAIADAKLVQ